MLVEVNIVLLIVLLFGFLWYLINKKDNLEQTERKLEQTECKLDETERELNETERELDETKFRLNSLGILEEIKSRIHREDGPAIYLTDNKVAYFWHGIHVPEHVVTAPETITPNEVVKAENIEYRRILLERMGIGNFITKIGGEQEQKDKWGILWRVWRENAAKQLFSGKIITNRENGILDSIFGVTFLTKFVQVKDSSSNRVYFLQVPSTMRTAHAAIAWSFNLNETEYDPIYQT